jgi:tetratricopeptide (TPR) repeat protein
MEGFMSRHGILITILAIGVLLLSGCASLTPLQKGELSYRQGRVADAEVILKPLGEKTKDNNYPLFQLSLGTVELSLGDYERARNYFESAAQNLDVELGAGKTGRSLLKSKAKWPYRGYPHEKVLARTYAGLAYFQQGKYNDARIEFAKARQADKGKTAAYEGDFSTTEFLDGINALREGRFNDAQVSFRKLTELKKDSPIGWYALCRASDLNHDQAEADGAWSRYESLSPAETRLARDGSTPCVIFLVDGGWGPFRTPNAMLGALGSWKESPATKTGMKDVKIASAGRPGLDAVEVDDLYYQVSTVGGMGKEVGKAIAGEVASRALGAIPVFGMFAPKNEADLRCWSMAPGTMHLAAVPVPNAPTTVELTCYDKRGTAINLDRQVLYYIGGRPFDQATIIYSRILPNADMRANLTLRSR